MAVRPAVYRTALALILGIFGSGAAFAHGIGGDDQAFLLRATGTQIGPYLYLGAKHMVTGYDHLLFLAGWHVDAYLVDAVIGLSVVYKAFENLGGFRRLGFEPSTKAAVLFFGFFHGLGLATKLQDLALSQDGLVANMVSFNVGVEIGQLLALGLLLIVFNLWRRSGGFLRHASTANVALMAAGFVLVGHQLTGFITS